MISLTDAQLDDFQKALDWKTGMFLPDGRVLGIPGKRGKVDVGQDSRVQLVRERLNPSQKTILEIGSCEGIHTVQLAQICKEVVALEVRPKNICCSLARLFVHDVRNVRLLMKDVRRELKQGFGRFDVVFHVGVLYHLMDPVQHIFDIRDLADDLVLDTHYGDDKLAFERTTIKHGGKSYRACVYKGEGGWRDSFSGVEAASLWLDRASLLGVLHDAGFDSVEVIRDVAERNGPRICILARRTRR